MTRLGRPRLRPSRPSKALCGAFWVRFVLAGAFGAAMWLVAAPRRPECTRKRALWPNSLATKAVFGCHQALRPHLLCYQSGVGVRPKDASSRRPRPPAPRQCPRCPSATAAAAGKGPQPSNPVGLSVWPPPSGLGTGRRTALPLGLSPPARRGHLNARWHPGNRPPRWAPEARRRWPQR